MKKFSKKRFTLAFTLVLFVMGVLVATFIIVTLTAILLQYAGIISVFNGPRTEMTPNDHPWFPVVVIFILCILLGTTLTTFFSQKALLPIRKVIQAMKQVSEGDFDVEVQLKGIEELEELSQSFNKMTQELKGIETLRSDFVNNFSHEFKTPIVSIRGFAKLLKDSQLSEVEREEYLDIIITEAERLSDLSTNVLNLSKYDAIEIVTNKKDFRLDEQIRRAVVLMEPKWSKKQLQMNIELEEFLYKGNEDLTQQIWLNLLDNAIKFSGINSTIHINLSKEGHFSIKDEGPGMLSETSRHIFDRFYQGDTSHAIAGNGLGLALVKRIVDLCEGEIEVESELGKGSTFIIQF